MHSTATQVKNSHLCLTAEIKITIWAALITDEYEQCDSNQELNSIIKPNNSSSIRSEANRFIVDCIEEVMSIFENTYQRVLIPQRILSQWQITYKRTVKMLIMYGFAEKIINENFEELVDWEIEDDVDSTRVGEETFYIGPTLGTAFGAICDIGLIKQSNALLRRQDKLLMLVRCKEMNIIKNLHRLIEGDKEISVIDIDNQGISAKDLLRYYKSGGCNGYKKKLLTRLYNKYNINSHIKYNARDRCQTIQKLNIELIKKAMDKTMIKITSNAERYAKTEVKQFIDRAQKNNKHIILVTTRDDNWVGSGQPWRNMDIEYANHIIRKLLKEGYYVCRFNLIGNRSSIIHDKFIDLCRGEYFFEDQLLLSRHCQINIGAATGATDIARQLFGKPTIYIETSTLYQYSSQAWTINISKQLVIKNSEIWGKTPREERIRLLFKSLWNENECSNHGLELRNKKIGNIISEIMESIEHIGRRMVGKSQYEMCNINEDKGFPTVRISKQTSEMCNILLK